MGDHKFKLSNMMPNAWFYKLKEMREKKRNSHSNYSQTNMAKRKQSAAAVQSSKPHQLSNPRKSYYFTRDPIANDKFYNPPRQYPKFPDTNIPAGKSPKQTRPRRKLSNSSPKPLSSSVSADSVWTNRSESSPEFSQTSLETEFRSDQALPTEKAFDETPSRSPESVITEAELPPIVTRGLHFCRADALAGGYIKKREEKKSPSRKLSGHSPRVRIRLNSPRIANKRVGQTQTSARRSSSRRSISDSFAVVKSSFNPQVDFRESMVEMILENNIRTSKDLEDLLACYLTLNSDEYHDLIIKVFKEIWFDLIN